MLTSDCCISGDALNRMWFRKRVTFGAMIAALLLALMGAWAVLRAREANVGSASGADTAEIIDRFLAPSATVQPTQNRHPTSEGCMTCGDKKSEPKRILDRSDTGPTRFAERETWLASVLGEAVALEWPDAPVSPKPATASAWALRIAQGPPVQTWSGTLRRVSAGAWSIVGSDGKPWPVASWTPDAAVLDDQGFPSGMAGFAAFLAALCGDAAGDPEWTLRDARAGSVRYGQTQPKTSGPREELVVSTDADGMPLRVEWIRVGPQHAVRVMALPQE